MDKNNTYGGLASKTKFIRLSQSEAQSLAANEGTYDPNDPESYNRLAMLVKIVGGQTTTGSTTISMQESNAILLDILSKLNDDAIAKLSVDTTLQNTLTDILTKINTDIATQSTLIDVLNALGEGGALQATLSNILTKLNDAETTKLNVDNLVQGTLDDISNKLSALIIANSGSNISIDLG